MLDHPIVIPEHSAVIIGFWISNLQWRSGEEKPVAGVDQLQLLDEATFHVFDAMPLVDHQTLPGVVADILREKRVITGQSNYRNGNLE